MSLVPIFTAAPTVAAESFKVEDLLSVVEHSEKEAAEAEDQADAAAKNLFLTMAKSFQAQAEKIAALEQRNAALETQKKEMEVLYQAKETAAGQQIESLYRLVTAQAVALQPPSPPPPVPVAVSTPSPAIIRAAAYKDQMLKRRGIRN
jgi:hypothetical protein